MPASQAPTALITGAARNLGLAFVRHYAGQGWLVIATCRDPASATDLATLARDSSGRVRVEALDVGDEASVGALAARLGGTPIDLLVNNAAIPGSGLRQPFGETLLAFLCSATKQIVQIKQMLALVAERHGALIAPGVHRLPTWAELATLSEADLRRCQLGFRARYVHATAQHLAAETGWLEATEAAPYAEAHKRLCALPGVGEKVADCVLLFGAGKLEAFPVDVWIARTLAERYDLRDWKLPALARFGRVHFGAAAGFAQQFLFAWERRAAGR